MARVVDRRTFLGMAGTAAAGAGMAAAVWRARTQDAIDFAQRFDPGSARSLSDIDHFVLLMQENRSFDQYFGSMSDVVGFDNYVAQVDRGQLPRTELFRLHGGLGDDLLFADPDHTWAAAHDLWNGGRIDLSRVRGGTNVTRRAAGGYFTRSELPVHYALADAFTICDHYHSSVLGPTPTNRLYWMSASIDPSGAAGGPIVKDIRLLRPGSLSWRTFPENLTDAGVSWKVYNAHNPSVRTELSGMLKYFANYQDPGSELAARGLAPRWPHDFAADVLHGTLPSVSWIVPPWSTSEHPSRPPAVGAEGIMTVLRTLLSNPKVWERTALIVSYDENGGFFDHVAPPVPPPGTAGEFVAQHGERAEPIGLGFRVPCLVISPLTRGGMVSPRTYDHTSQLRLISTRFGVPIPNLTSWRESVTGDMTELFEPGGWHAGPAATLPGDRHVDTLAAQATDAWRAEEHEPADQLPNISRHLSIPRQATSPVRYRL